MNKSHIEITFVMDEQPCDYLKITEDFMRDAISNHLNKLGVKSWRFRLTVKEVTYEK